MAAGTASYSDISSVVNDIQADSLAVARMANIFLPTITNLNAVGMNPRKVQQWAALAFTSHTEEQDEASVAFSKSALSTLTPANYHCRADLTDERVASDWESVRAACAMELGSAAAKHIDTMVATLAGTASGWTGGTIGPANAGTASAGTITWRSITKAQALLVNAGVPAGSPIYCALHPYQWEVLLAANSIAAATVAVAPGFQDRMSSSGGFFQIPAFLGVTFVISNAFDIASTAAYGLMYSPQAIALDSRKAFGIEPERDASKQAWELNASMWYAYGVWDPARAVLLRHHCVAPS
jgi:hypothetical protein